MISTKVQGLQGKLYYVLEASITFQGEPVQVATINVPIYRKSDFKSFEPSKLLTDVRVGGYFGFAMSPSINEFTIDK